MSILSNIILDKKTELARAKSRLRPEEMRRMAAEVPAPKSLQAALSGRGLRLIAEVKKASPSRGLLCKDFDPVRLAETYTRHGAAAISVLTERAYFMGDIAYLTAIKEALGKDCPPLLRKDFILDEYQIFETSARGGDSLLLIVAALERSLLEQLLGLGKQLGMDCLTEVHNESEMAVALDAGAGIIGINNRDLATFRVDLEVTRRLRPLVPPGIPVVAESGIKTREDVILMKKCGVDAVLVGEALVTAGDIGRQMELYLDQS